MSEPEGTYHSIGFDEFFDAFGVMGPEVTSMFRPVVDVPDDPDPGLAMAPIRLAALGPDVVSSETALLPMSALPIWDVNGYYRSIGIGYPYRPTKREMRESYQATGGPENDYATYAFKRLLDPEFRLRYDRRPLGKPIDDYYGWWLVRKLASRAARHQSRLTGRVVTVRDVLGEDVLGRVEAAAEEEERAEYQRQQAHDDVVQEAHDFPESVGFWPFAFYLWGARSDDDRQLRAWQELLITAFARQGLSIHFAVGYVDGTSDEAIRVRHRRPDGSAVEILFLRLGVAPTACLADIVVATFHTHPAPPLEHAIPLSQ